MPPRFARIVDNSPEALQTAMRNYPQFAAELLQQRQATELLQAQKTAQSEAKIRAGQPLKASDVDYVQSVLEPGVYYSKNWLPNKSNPGTLENGLPNGGYVDFVRTHAVPMGDWDWPDNTYHSNHSVTIRHLGDVYDRLERFTSDNPNSLWQTYLTPGGVRAFEMGDRYTPKGFAAAGHFDALSVDPFYEKLAIRPIAPPKEFSSPLLYPEQSWSARVSGKPGRTDDFVAFPLGTVGKAPIHSYNRRIIDTYHDLPIMRSMVNDGMQIGTLPTSGITLLEQQLSTVPRRFAVPIERRLQAMGVIS